MNEPTLQADLAALLNDVLGTDTARPIEGPNLIVALADSADRGAAITAVRRLLVPHALRAHPVMLWHGGDEVLLGPAGTLDVTAVVPTNRSLDVQILPGSDGPARVTISWLDGPTADSVRDALGALADIGLNIDLVREDLDQLVKDVLLAVFDPVPAGRQAASHPVLDRVAAVRDGCDIYYELLSLTTAVVRRLHRAGSDRAVRNAMLATMIELGQPVTVDAVLEDVETRLRDGAVFPVQVVEDAAKLAALFTLTCLLAQSLSSNSRRQIRAEFAE